MTNIDAITLDVADIEAAERFYSKAFGLGSRLRLRPSQASGTGFRGFTLSLIVARPADVNALFAAAVAAGATTLKPVAKSMWGHGGVVQAPDGTIWKIATSAKKDTGPATGRIESIVLLLGTNDVRASKQCYVDHGFTVAKSFGRMYVEFEAGEGAIKLALYRRKALAKDAGVPEEGTGSHHITIASTATFTDPDGFTWEKSPITATS
jgi:catechol 2,3-dioxygenase-like lactoylglutathione lyase family enzyme